MIEWNGERYCTAAEAADLLHVSRPTFYVNVRNQLKLHELPARKRLHYRVSEVESYRHVREISQVAQPV